MKIQDMSLQEKILQTVVARMNVKQEFPQNVGAGFFFGEIITQADEMGFENARMLLDKFKANCEIPPLITSDFENGCGGMFKGLTALPYLMSLGTANDEELAYNYGKVTAMEAASIGANWSFSPVADVNLNARNPLVNVRAIGDNPEQVSKMTRQIVRGMQENGLAACAKHFPGDGIDWRDQHIVTTNNTLCFEDWQRISGKVFEDLIQEGVYSIMAGHITLPCYQEERHSNGMYLPATLSYELIDKLLKKEMGFEGVVVTDALDMGGFNGWYSTKQQSEIEAFKAGCDMVLWPTKDYVKNMTEAIENGYVSMERLDDAVSRILNMKEKLGLFDGDKKAEPLSEQDKIFVKRVQTDTADKSITLVRDEINAFPLSVDKFKKIAVTAISQFESFYEQGETLCKELRERGFQVDYFPDGGMSDEVIDQYDLIMYAVFSRPCRPIGFIDFQGSQAIKVHISLHYGVEKTVVVSLGSPYLGEQYFERALTYVNAYSALDCSVEAFVRAAVGEVEFTEETPVKIYRHLQEQPYQV